MESFFKLLFLFALIIPVYPQAVQVLELAVQVFEVIELFKPDDSEPVSKTEMESIMNELSVEIQASELNIVRSIMLQSRFDRIDDALIQIKSSLQDLSNYMNASTSTREYYKSIFIDNFENGEVSLIRFLPTLLTYQNPARHGALLPLLMDDTRCNLTTLDKFQVFYSKLMSSGIAIDLAYKVLKFHMSEESALKEWMKPSKDIEVKFQATENHCQSLFTKYAKQDLTEAISAHALQKKNNAWEPWKSNDVFFSKKYGTFQFVYFEYEDDTVLWQKSDTNDKVAVFYQPYLYENRLPSNALTDSTERFRSAITGEDDETAAKHVAESVKAMLKEDGYIIEALVVLFDDGDSEEALAPDSPAVSATIDNVKLTYCYENRVRCGIDVANVWDSTKTASGSFKIYVYAHDTNITVQHSVHHTGAANKLTDTSAALIIAVISFTALSVW